MNDIMTPRSDEEISIAQLAVFLLKDVLRTWDTGECLQRITFDEFHNRSVKTFTPKEILQEVIDILEKKNQ